MPMQCYVCGDEIEEDAPMLTGPDGVYCRECFDAATDDGEGD